MSEKKTAEIKLRIEPSRKSRYQQAAENDGLGLSEFITRATDEYCRTSLRKVQAFVIGEQLVTLTLPTTAEVDAVNSVPTSEAEKRFGEDWKPWG